MSDEQQNSLFTAEEIEIWRQEWKDMPEYSHVDLQSWKALIVHFATPGDYERFKEVVERKNLTDKSKSFWYPEQENASVKNKRYIQKTRLI